MPLATPLLLVLLVSAGGHAHYFGHLQHSVRDAALHIEQRIGKRDATIVGQSSPAIVLGTPYRNFYVRGRFNSARARLAGLRITHVLLLREDGVRTIIERKFKGIMLGRGPILTMVVRGDTYGLFDIEGQLIVPEKRKKKKRQLRRSRRRVR